MRATLTDAGCTYEGDEMPRAGMFTVEVENQTEYVGAFALAAIAEGSTIEGDLDRSSRRRGSSGSSLQRFRLAAVLRADRPRRRPARRDHLATSRCTRGYVRAHVLRGRSSNLAGLRSPRNSTYRNSDVSPPGPPLPQDGSRGRLPGGCSGHLRQNAGGYTAGTTQHLGVERREAAPPIHCSVRGCEPVRVDVPLYFVPEVGRLDIRVPEVDPRPDPSFEHLVRHIREPRKKRCSPGKRLLVSRRSSCRCRRTTRTRACWHLRMRLRPTGDRGTGA